MNHTQMWRFSAEKKKKKQMGKAKNDHNLIQHTAQRGKNVTGDVRAYDLTIS